MPSGDRQFQIALKAALCRLLVDLPPRVSAEIAAELDPRRVSEILRRELTAAVAILDRMEKDAR